MSNRIEESVTINAPKEYVWDILQNLARRTEWDARVTSARALSSSPINRGSRIRVVTRMYGMNFPTVLEYISWNPPFRSAVKSIESGNGVESVVGSWKLEENEKGETTWTTTLVVTAQPGLYGRLITRMLSRSFEKLTIQSQKQLKALIEREYPQHRMAEKVPTELMQSMAA